jgi:hypothetical protein
MSHTDGTCYRWAIISFNDHDYVKGKDVLRMNKAKPSERAFHIRAGLTSSFPSGQSPPFIESLRERTSIGSTIQVNSSVNSSFSPAATDSSPILSSAPLQYEVNKQFMRWISLSDRSLDHFLYSLIRLCHQLIISPIASLLGELTSTEFFLASALLELAHLAADPSKMILVAYLISFVL